MTDCGTTEKNKKTREKKCPHGRREVYSWKERHVPRAFFAHVVSKIYFAYHVLVGYANPHTTVLR